MSPLPDELDALITTLRRALELKGMTVELRVLNAAVSDLVQEGSDNWDGGRFFYTLYLDIPIDLFVEIEDRIPGIEKSLLQQVRSIRRGEGNERVTEVTIRTRPVAPTRGLPLAAGLALDPAFWQVGAFRAFLGHVSSIKDTAFALKAAFSPLHITAFVAHEDIEPTADWQEQIELALQTMDALVALVTPDFVQSRWCDQEVGIAIGRGRLVVPVRMGADPHGFLAKYQGLSGAGKLELQIAQEVFTVLARHDATRTRLASSVVEGFAASDTYAGARRNMDLVEQLPALTPELGRRIRQAVGENSQIADNYAVPRRVDALLQRQGL